MPEQGAGKEQVPIAVRLRRAGLFVLFGLVLLIPKTLGLRRRLWVWNGLRLVVALAGAVLMAAGRGSFSAWVASAAGLLLLLLALVARPGAESKSVDAQARELGALVVLNGGRFCGANGKRAPARLFLGPERLDVLDFQHRPLLTLSLAAVSALRVEPVADGWNLLLEGNESIAEFHYDGFFAEHLARVAETSLRSQLRRALPVIR